MDQAEASSTIRRYHDMLSISGIAIIAFSAWDIAKSVLTSIYGSDRVSDGGEVGVELEAALRRLSPEEQMALVAMVVVLMVLALVGIVLRFYVGLSAHAEARGKHKGWAYVIIAGIMAITSAAFAILGLVFSQRLDGSPVHILGVIATGAIELTSLLAYFDLIRSAVMVKRLTRCQREG